MTNMTTEPGVISVATKLAELIEKAPAGGIFHDATISEVAGLEVPGFVGVACFVLQTRTGKVFNVEVVETSVHPNA